MFVSEDIENFMESAVDDEISQLGLRDKYDDDQLKDLYCLTLNQLPAKYVRYSLDVRMNLTSQEGKELSQQVREAIAMAEATLLHDRRKQREL